MSSFTMPFGNVTLQRYPAAHDQSLRAWCSADELLLQRFYQSAETKGSGSKLQNLLIVNDEFGALSVALANKFNVTHWSDSLLSQKATERNAANNSVTSICCYSSTDNIAELIPDAILIRPTKNISYLQYQLAMLSHYFPDTAIYCGIMQKFITTGVKAAINQYLTRVEPGMGEKKARVISARTPDESHYTDAFNQVNNKQNDSEAGEDLSHHWLDNIPAHIQPGLAMPLKYINYKSLKMPVLPNVFSSGSLDIGARFLLDNFPNVSSAEHIADLGCGNGVLSAAAALQNSQANLYGFDESYLAVASAKLTFYANRIVNKQGNIRAQFTVSNMLSHAQDAVKFDIILCNPPFHQERRVTTDTAKLMFKQARSKLSSNGQLWVIANRHLGYYRDLAKQFHRVETVSSNAKFSIFCAENS